MSDRPFRSARRLRLLALAAAVSVAAAGCGGAETPEAPAASERGHEVIVQVASYDLAVGGERRFIVGLLTLDNRFVSGGTAVFRLAPIGEEGAVREVEASFLAVPGEEAEHEHPEAGGPETGRGVYAATVAFDRPGTWQVEVEVEVEGEARSGTAAFHVAEEPAVPMVGEPALRTENHTIDDHDDAPLAAVDSRAGPEGEIPDPELHRTTIAAALRQGRPIVAVFATPVYCVSQFCGPITDMVAELAADYGDRAEFVHVEIWRDFQDRVINRAAADWLLRNDDLQEPWVFFIDAEGTIAARWDNVATREEIEPYLRDLPPLR
jgi:hypothetical protein